jgi:antitoxin component of MazEF toxin-antitoxin module
VRLQKRFAYKYKNKDHYKYVVTIPSETIEQLHLQPDTELEVAIENKNILLKPRIGVVTSKIAKRKG